MITLSGLESKLISSKERIRNQEKINFISYADDFIITSADEELLNNKVIPIIERFLAERGLELSKEKTKITHISKGVDFLGFNIRKYSNNKVLTKPAKENIKSFIKEIKETIMSNIPLQTDKLIHLLNPKIIGWCNYYKTVVSSRVFSYIDSRIYKTLHYWTNRRHPNKGKRWIAKKYFTSYRLSEWRFYAKVKDKDGNIKLLYLKRASDTKIKRHIKIRGAANPFDPQFKEYFESLDQKRRLPSAISLLGSA